MARKLFAKTVTAFLPLDLIFKVLVTIGLLGVLGVESRHDRNIVVKLVVLMSVPAVAGWLIALWWMLRPIARFFAHGEDIADRERSTRRVEIAGAAAYRTPRSFAIVWALHWFAVFTTVPLLLRAGIPEVIATPARLEVGVVFFSATMIGGALSLGYTFIAWLLVPVAGAISLEARKLEAVIPALPFSLRTRLVLLALCLGLTPSTWFASFTYVESMRAAFRTADMRAQLLVAERSHGEHELPETLVTGADARVLSAGDRARHWLEREQRLSSRIALAAERSDRGTFIDPEHEIVVAYAVVPTMDRHIVAAIVEPDTSTVTYVLGMIAIFMFAVIIWASVCAVLLGSTVSSALSRVADAMREITRRGSAIAVARIPVFQRDEAGLLVDRANEMIDKLESTEKGLETATAELAEKRLLEKEFEIGVRIQTSILPRRVEIRGLEIAATMRPATQVGGDYYDLLPTPGGAFIGIGDVAGHGLASGLVMLMVQSAIAALVQERPGGSPANILGTANRVLFENIRTRLGQREHVTLSLLRYSDDGTIVFAGAHEDILVVRASTGRCELIETPGTWLGIVADVGAMMVDTTLRLEHGDLLVLYTDGLTEAFGADGSLFGLERLIAAVETAKHLPVEKIRESVLSEVGEFQRSREDDETLLIIRHSRSDRPS